MVTMVMWMLMILMMMLMINNCDDDDDDDDYDEIRGPAPTHSPNLADCPARATSGRTS